MKRWAISIALVAVLAQIFLHGYLTLHFYPLQLGMSEGQSVCNINATMNCDAVSASRYAQLFGVPVALWGLMTSTMLFLLLLFYRFNLTPDLGRLSRWIFYWSSFAAVASIVMASISTFLISVYCLFCISVYILSLIAWEMSRRMLPAKLSLDEVKKDIVGLTGSLSYLSAIVAVPVLTYIAHFMIISGYGATSMSEVVEKSINQWKSNPSVTFAAPPLLTLGPPAHEALIVIEEFADFLCSHCRHAAPVLDAFVSSRSNVSFKFYSYPLDGDCNPSIPQSNGGSRCVLAKAVFCSEKEKQGWNFHHYIFENQETLAALSNEQIKSRLQKEAEEKGLNAAQMLQCLDSTEAQEAIVSNAKMGDLGKFRGTPTIFVNGKILPGGQLLPVLESAYNEILAVGKAK